MILEHQYKKYPPQYEIVTNGNTLNAFVRRGYINKTKYGAFPQVEAGDNYSVWGFEYKGNDYRLEYFDGSFYQFVIKILNNTNLTN